MLALDQEITPGIFADHADPKVQHIVPDTLRLAMAEGRPDFQLMLFRSATQNGGQLTARFEAVHTTQGRPGDPTARQQRIALRSQANDLDVLLDWQPVFAERDGSILFRHTMTAHQAGLAVALAEDGSPLLELTLIEDRPAMRGPQPWQVTGPMAQVHGLLAAQLGTAPVDQQALAMAVRGLGDDILHWTARGAHTSTPDEAAWAALQSRVSASLFTFDADGLYSLQPLPAADQIDLRLDRPWAEMLRTRLTWGFDQAPELIAEDTFAHHFPQVDQSDPFRNEELTISNHLPLDPLSAQSVHVDLAFTSQTGTQTHESFVFGPDSDQVQRMGIVIRDVAQQFEVQTRARVLLPPSGGQGFPVFWPRDAAFVDEGATLNLIFSTDRLDVQLRHHRVFEDVFAIADKVHITLESDVYRTQITLDADTPKATTTLPGRDTVYTTTVVAERDGVSHALTPWTDDRGVILLPFNLIPAEPVAITTTIAPDIVLAIVEWEPASGQGRLQTGLVTPTDSPDLHFWPASVFDPTAIRWRARVVRRDAAGNTQPMTDGDWAETTVPHFDIT